MSANPQQPTHMSEADYLALDDTDEDICYEYINGDVVAMSGGKPAHTAISMDILVELAKRLDGKPYEVFNPDMRVRYNAVGNYYYPDVVVVCGEPNYVEGQTVGTLTNPTIIFEVSSPSTAERDKTLKWEHYQNIPSLQEYIIVEQNRPQVWQFVRQTENPKVQWLYEATSGLDKTLRLPTLDVEIPLRAIYRRAELD